MRYPISFSEPIYIKEPLASPTYEFNSKGRRPMLQKIAFWLLSKTGARRNDMSARIEYVAVDINESKIHELLEKSGALELIYYTRPKTILVGPDFYYKILDGELRSAVSFHARQTLTDGRGGYEVYGFEIVLVPHMSGFLPLPEWRKIDQWDRP